MIEQDREPRLWLPWVIFVCALLIGIATRIAMLPLYQDFDGDQARDAWIYVGMLHGVWPLSRAITSFHTVDLPPLYYYLVFPFTLLGLEPWKQTLFNALCSLGTIPLIGLVLYRLLVHTAREKRLVCAAIGALWWSVLYPDILLGTREWNPSPLVFFSLLFALVAAEIVRKPLPNAKTLGAWGLLGVLFAILLSLHGTAVLVMPFVFAFVAISFVALVPAAMRVRSCACVLTGILTTLLCLTPYWYSLAQLQSEIRHARAHQIEAHQAQSLQVKVPQLRTLVQGVSAQPPTSWEERLHDVWRTYRQLDGQAYFVGAAATIRTLGAFFLVSVAILAASLFRGDRQLFGILASIWVVYLVIVAVVPAEHQPVEIHYKLLILSAPLLLTLVVLGSLRERGWMEGLLSSALLFCIALSMLANLSFDLRRARTLFLTPRRTTTRDLVSAFDLTPVGGRVCDSDAERLSDRYLDTYLAHRGLVFLDRCLPGTYEVLPRVAVAHDDRDDGDDRLLQLDEPATVTPPPRTRLIASGPGFQLLLHDAASAPLR